jgi:hypothetical protein
MNNNLKEKEDKELEGLVVPELEEGVSPETLQEASNSIDSVNWDEFSKDLEREQKFGDRPLEAAATAAASSATFSGSDYLLKKAGFRTEEDLANLREFNPEADIIGSAMGVVVPAVASGGSSLLAKGVAGAAAPVTAALKAGTAVERAVLKSMASAGKKSAAQQIVKKAGAKGAGSAVEGALLSTGALMREDQLGAADLNAENLLSFSGTGALFGGIVGTAVPLVGKGLTGGGKTLKSAVAKESSPFSKLKDKYFSREEAAAGLAGLSKRDMQVYMSSDSGRKFLKDLPDFWKNDVKISVGDVSPEARLAKLEAFLQDRGGALDNYIDNLDKIAKANPDKVPAKRDFFSKLAKQIDEDYIKPFESRGTDFKDLVGKAKQLRGKLAQMADVGPAPTLTSPDEFLTAEYTKLSSLKAPAKPADYTLLTSKALEKFQRQQDAFLKAQNRMAKLERDAAVKSRLANERIMRDYQSKLNQKLSPATLREIKKDIDAITSVAYKSPNPMQAFNANKAARSIINDTIIEMSENLSGKQSADVLRKLNRDIHYGLNVMKSLEKAAAAKSPLITVKDFIFGTIGYGVGNVPGLLVAGANKFYQSDLRKTLQVLKSIEKSNKAVEKRTKDSVKSFFTDAKKPARLAGTMAILNTKLAVNKEGKEPKNKDEAFKNIRANLQELQQNPAELDNRLARTTSALSAAAPETALQYAEGIQRGIQFLTSKMPNPRTEVNMLGLEREYKPSSMEMAKFQRYIQAIEMPMTLFDELESGTLTREHVEALKAVYPNLYARIQDEAAKMAQEHGSKLSYSKRVQLGILLDIPTDDSLLGKNIQALQQTFGAEQASQAQGQATQVRPTVGGAKNIKISTRLKSDTEDAMEGIE